ncbi:GNAT family N-acetyltransferase [uncultured Ferrimonas sp.]|uniref:GNAT family N-acetyltransferase n=1 Tax=uncultured Ferrimonas sp. TaxID=432640 RepID=UPI0026142AB5|nr:GNAT family N-acetyltransferase [uncultured Ferrimonas sp.]
MISRQWRQGSIAEVVALSQQIPEFDAPYGVDEYQRRLQHSPHLIQIAEVEGEPVGFYVSYAKSSHECYLWMSGVLPEFRGLGLASLQLEGLQQWAQRFGFDRLTVKSRNRYASKLQLLLRHGFHITSVDPKSDDSLDFRIHFCKALTPLVKNN